MPFRDIRLKNQKTLIFPNIYGNSAPPERGIMSIGQQRDAILYLDDTHYTCVRSESIRKRSNQQRERRLLDVSEERDGNLVLTQHQDEPFLIYPIFGIERLTRERILLGRAQNTPSHSDGMPIRLLFRSNGSCDYGVWDSDLLLEPYQAHEHKTTEAEYNHLIKLADEVFLEQGAKGGIDQVRHMFRPPAFRPQQRPRR